MTLNILTAGHIKCLKSLSEDNFVVVGLLTPLALQGYKDEIVPYKDRLYILKHLNIPSLEITPQSSLNPTQEIKKYKCDAIASGDGFHPEEIKAIKELGLKEINIKLKGEGKEKLYSSSKIINKLKQL